MQFPDSFFEDEVRDGFYVPALMKRAWAAKLEVLADVAAVCEKFHLQWFADFGTLLGAVRHRGFIPWDDDIDICMLRDDYIRFRQIAEKELPEGYYLIHDLPEDYRLITPVFNTNGTRLEKKHLEKFHGFPFPTAIDIFALDYVAPDPEDEEFRKNLIKIIHFAASLTNDENENSEQIQDLSMQIEEMLQVTLDRSKPLKTQLLALRDNLFALYTGDTEVQEVALMHHWVNDEPYKYPIQAFRNPVFLPFEVMEIPVPAVYDQVLTAEFGDYMKFCRTGSSHDYPFFEPLKQELIKRLGENALPFLFRFSSDSLQNIRAGHKEDAGKIVENFVQLAGQVHEEIINAINQNEPDMAKELLGACQNSAIQIGTLLEQSADEEARFAVGLLEEYCEFLWQIHENLDKALTIKTSEIHNHLNELLKRITGSNKKDVRAKKEIVFVPFKASLWDSLKPFWMEAQANPDYDVYVIPVPYFYKNTDGTLREMRYEGNQFPEEVSVTDCNCYDFEKRRPDIIFIQNPYDEYNLTTTIHPFFYSRNLIQYTEQLIYVPWFLLDETDLKDPKAVINMEYYVTVPGVVYADRVVVQSEPMRQAYIDFLTTSAGEDTRTIWEEKITCEKGNDRSIFDDII